MIDFLLALNPPMPIVQESIQISQNNVFYPAINRDWTLTDDRLHRGTTVRVVGLKLDLPAGDFALIEFLGARYDVFLGN